MRTLFFVLAVANVLMFGLGQGWFGPPRTEAGRQSALLQAQVNPQALTIGQVTLQSP
jgi:hypothetical protein